MNNIFTEEKIHIYEPFVTHAKDGEMLDNEETQRKKRAQSAKDRLTLKSHKRRLTEITSNHVNEEDTEREEKQVKQLENELGRLKRSLESENNSTKSMNVFDDEEEVDVDVIDISSSDLSNSDAVQVSKQYIPMPGLPGNKIPKFVFLPLGPSSRKRVAQLFNSLSIS